MKGKKFTVTRLLIIMSVLFLLIAGIGLHLGSNYIRDKLLHSEEAMAVDIALLVRNNFQITDSEVEYMRALTFNEMEVDPINQRLMDIGNGVVLHVPVSNVYLLTPLSEEDYRYCPDVETAKFLGFTMDTPLNGVWLLNGRINDRGLFEIAQREDIFRYTALDDDQLWGMEHRKAFGTFSTDAWGNFITGYAPVYTVEGNFVGLLGIDMDPDQYQSSAQNMILLIITIFIVIMVIFSALSVVFLIRYSKAREAQSQFKFYSRMSHEMRNPLNGILGIAALSKDETDVAVLRRNFELIENSGNYLLKLINRILDYQHSEEQSENSVLPEQSVPCGGIASEPDFNWPEIVGKRVLLCEDHPTNAQITRRIVEKAGCSIDIAEDGQCGLTRFTDAPDGYYDAILMDIRMPVLDGLEAARRIRAMKGEYAQNIPIIALTANSYEEDIKNTMKAGMNAHLTKPVNPLVLYKTLSEVLHLTRQKKMKGGNTDDQANNSYC